MRFQLRVVRMTPRQLRPYQFLTAEFMADVPRCNVWLGMGLGKTVSSLTALGSLSVLEPGIFPALVIAPLRVARSTWPAEVAEWRHLRGIRVVPIVGDLKQREWALRQRAEVYSVNYEQLPWLTERLGDDWPFKTVIADESSRLKNHRAHFRLEKTGRRTLVRTGTQRARAISKAAIKYVKRWVNLTGTPSANGLQDLWGQAWFLDFGHRLGSDYGSFEQRYFKTGFNGHGLEPLEHAEAEIQRKLADVTISLQSKDYFDLPPLIENDIYVDLPDKARRHYDEMEKTLFTELDGTEIEAFNAASKTMKLLQFANGAAYTDDKGSWALVHDEKIEALKDVVEEAAGMPVLVAYHFKSDLARLQKAFPRGRKLDQSSQTIADWNRGRIPMLFAHPASAGHGLNLQHGSNILAFFSLNWNLEEHAQILERIGPVRQAQAGLNRPVFVHYIKARRTIDDVVHERLRTKRSVQDCLLDAMRARRV